MVSVIIPTYNRAAYIVKSIESVLAQTYQDIEIIVVDDASTDDTGARIFELSHPKVKYFCNDKNRGCSYTRNRGVAEAAGEYIAFQDSDDLWLPEKLALQMDKLLKDQTDMCFCAFKTSTNVHPNEESAKEIFKREPDLFTCLLCVQLIGTPTILCKRECFLNLGGFDESIYAFEDYDFSLRFSEKYKISYIEKPLVNVRAVDNGINTNYDEILRVRCMLLKRYIEQLLNRNLFGGFLDTVFRIEKRCSPEARMRELNALNLFIQEYEEANLDADNL